MTCIAGMVHDGRVYVGGDSAGVAGWELAVRADSKVFTNGEFVMGFSSSFRMGQLLRYALEPPALAPGADVHRFMATTFVDAVRECLKQGGWARREKEQEAGGYFLVGYRGRLFSVAEDYQVGESHDGIDAVGCGSQVALGALHVLRTCNNIPPEKRVRMALQAAERWNNGVRAPFVVEAAPPAEPAKTF